MITVNQALMFYIATMIGLYFLLPELRQWRDNQKYGHLIRRIAQLERLLADTQDNYTRSLNKTIKTGATQRALWRDYEYDDDGKIVDVHENPAQFAQLSFDLGGTMRDKTVSVNYNGSKVQVKQSDLMRWNSGKVPVRREDYDSRGRNIGHSDLWVNESDVLPGDRVFDFSSLEIRENRQDNRETRKNRRN